jgi:cytochrome c-type biogenesis protein CcsB
MKKIYLFFSSPRLMAILLFIFVISIASATFIENSSGITVARALVYNAAWFNLLLFLIALSLLCIIIEKRLYYKEKIPQFIFHSAFIIILTGAAITRFHSYEGIMTIREGSCSDKFAMNKNYFQLSVIDNDKKYTLQKQINVSATGINKKSIKLKYNKNILIINILKYFPYAVKSAIASKGGIPVAEFIAVGQEGRKKILIKGGESVIIDTLMLSFNSDDSLKSHLILYNLNNELFFKCSFPINCTDMTNHTPLQLNANQVYKFLPRLLYDFNGVNLVLLGYLPEARIDAIPVASDMENDANEAIKVRIMSDNSFVECWLWKTIDDSEPEKLIFNNKELYLSFISCIVRLPFSLFLTDFILERYPGSNSPSWYESRIILKDSVRKIEKTERIFMNNVLKYKGYRFYQTSYDSDEKGTILTVTHDSAGIVVTYTGYVLLFIGMILTLFNKKSRFRKILKETDEINNSKKLLMTCAILFMFVVPVISQNINKATVSASHAKEFGTLLIQDYDGRIKPLNTINLEILRKLYRQERYNGLNADQVLLSMIADPEKWQNEPIIQCRHPEILKLLGSQQQYFSFSSFFINRRYILQPYVESAYRKKPVYRDKFEKEIIKLNEKVSIAYMIFSYEMLKIFPKPEDNSNTWHSPVDAEHQFTGEDSFFISKVFPLYINACKGSLISGNWEEADKLLNFIKEFQKTYGASIIPSENKLEAEILLNKINPFDRISNFYGLIGLLLLIYQFIGLFYQQLQMRFPLMLAVFIIIFLFAVHTAGLGIRWYVSGHAPWSNGYEALIYIAWATVLAGILFARKSAITLSVTSIMSFLTLKMAHLSSMDPQITNLVPVLKSYWLVIHVATITASYGFLALGALLSFVNMLLMIFQNNNNFKYIELTIKELTNVVEMTLIIGLFLLTTGTFLGGVWANEAWGRYWGWDPKETWALVTIIIYAFVTHMRIVPGIKTIYSFNLLAFISFGTVIMTYFGVNYFLSGLHSYAKGEIIVIPVYTYIVFIIFIVIFGLAFYNRHKLYNQGIH